MRFAKPFINDFGTSYGKEGIDAYYIHQFFLRLITHTLQSTPLIVLLEFKCAL
jgi:hypothetical protein